MSTAPPSVITRDPAPPATSAPSEGGEPETDALLVVGLEDDGSRIWNAEEQFILHSSVKGYRKTPRTEKLDFVRGVAGKIKKLFGAKVGGEDNLKPGKSHYKEWQVKKDQVFAWMTKHARTTRTLRLPGMNQKFNFLKVFTEMKKEEIIREAVRLARAAGKTKYIGYYQKARNNIRLKLSDDELEEYSETARKWNSGEVPPDIQVLYASKYSKRVLDEMGKRNFLTMGMRSIILECHMGPKGKIIYSLNDSHALHLDDPRVPSFNRYNPGAAHAMTRAYAEYVNHVTGILNGIIQPLPAEVFEDKMLTYHPGGHPKVPDGIYNKQSHESNRIQQGMIRVYLNKIWQQGGGTGGSVQWTRVAETPNLFFNSGDLPQGFVIQDPGKYKAFQTVRILDLWRERQSKGEIPFTFLNVIVGSTVTVAQYPVGFHSGVAPTGPLPPKPIKRHARPSRHRVLSDSEPEDIPSNVDNDLAVTVDQPLLQPIAPAGSMASLEPVVPAGPTPPPSNADSGSVTGIVDIPDDGRYQSRRLHRREYPDDTPVDRSGGEPGVSPPPLRSAAALVPAVPGERESDDPSAPDVRGSEAPSGEPSVINREPSPPIRQTRSRAAIKESVAPTAGPAKMTRSKSKKGGRGKK